LWQKEFWKSYEAFAQRSRDAFGLEDVALWLSSIALSIGVAIAGLIPALGADFFTTIALFTAGVVGVVGSLLTQWFWVVQAARLNRPEGQTGPVG
jgi:hypothetical protein